MATTPKATPPNKPRYALGAKVRVLSTSEIGTITQACTNITGPPTYRVRVDIAGHAVFRPLTEADLEEA